MNKLLYTLIITVLLISMLAGCSSVQGALTPSPVPTVTVTAPSTSTPAKPMVTSMPSPTAQNTASKAPKVTQEADTNQATDVKSTDKPKNDSTDKNSGSSGKGGSSSGGSSGGSSNGSGSGGNTPAPPAPEPTPAPTPKPTPVPTPEPTPEPEYVWISVKICNVCDTEFNDTTEHALGHYANNENFSYRTEDRKVPK